MNKLKGLLLMAFFAASPALAAAQVEQAELADLMGEISLIYGSAQRR